MTETARLRGQRLFDRVGRPVPRDASELPDSFNLGFDKLLQVRGHVVGLTALDAWIVVAFLQLALRHPMVGEGIGPHGKRIARVLTKRIVQVAPELAEWVAKGWDPDYDVVVPDSGGR